jgi:hypothetical protein
VLITARELMQHPERARPAIRERVCRDAAAIAHQTSLDTIVPSRDTRRAIGGALVALLCTAIVWGIASRWPVGGRAVSASAGDRAGHGSADDAATPDAIGVRGVTLTITPPSYTGRPVTTLKDPVRVDALAGSRLQVQVEIAGGRGANGATTVTAVAAFNDRPQTLASNGPNRAGGELMLSESGVLTIAVRPASPASSHDSSANSQHDALVSDAPRIIAVSVVPDQLPNVEIVAPGKDLMLAEVDGRVEIAARAQDDLGLRSLTLRYTKVAGSGENYEFHEGELPLTLARADAKQWQGQVARRIRELGLAAGDMFVYYAVATDGRPGSERAVSDSYVIEIGKPGTAIAGGFAIPPEEDRSALSMNALIQKTEKLDARRTAMASEEFRSAAAGLAIEQRMVRTEFLFTMGTHGHVEDESEEAENSNEIQEGRMANRGQQEILNATRFMQRSEQFLTDAETQQALKVMRAALAAIQRALSRNRYFLRTLATSTEIDMSRRLTGDLSEAKSARWPTNDRTPDERLARIRQVLSDLSDLAAGLSAPLSVSETAAARAQRGALANAIAGRMLTIDPASVPLQKAAADLTRAGQMIATGDAMQATPLVRSAADAVLTLARASTPTATAAPAAPRSPLRGAVVDALRERGGSR